MASNMAGVVPVNSAGRLTQSSTFSADMAADMACGEPSIFSADTAAGMACGEQMSADTACWAHADLATRLGKSTPGLASHLDASHSAREGQKQPILDSAPRVHWETGPSATTDTADKMLRMPTRINLHEAGLRRSPRLQELATAKCIKRKAHVIFGKTMLKAVLLFTLFNNVQDVLPAVPSCPPVPHASFTMRAMHRFHELNELYDGTINEFHHFVFSNLDISSNESYTYQNAMKKVDSDLFIAAM